MPHALGAGRPTPAAAQGLRGEVREIGLLTLNTMQVSATAGNVGRPRIDDGELRMAAGKTGSAAAIDGDLARFL
jgi:hypothetical protein